MQESIRDLNLSAEQYSVLELDPSENVAIIYLEIWELFQLYMMRLIYRRVRITKSEHVVKMDLTSLKIGRALLTRKTLWYCHSLKVQSDEHADINIHCKKPDLQCDVYLGQNI